MHATPPLPDAYRRAIRTLIRFAVVMAVVALLSGLAWRESAKRLSFDQAPPGLHLEAVLPLALFHGHAFTTAVLLPLALAGALFLGLRIGGRELTRKSLVWLTHVYLPLTTVTLGLQLWKGYHLLIAVRKGATDLAAVDASFLAGAPALRYAVYGVAHGGMALGLVVFLVALWRSLKAAA